MAGTIIYGVRAVGEAIASGKYVNRLYLAKESRERGYEKIIDQARAQSIPFDFVPQAKLNAMTGTREHQGIAVAVSPVEYASLNDVVQACPARASLLMLDRVQHSKNLGLIIRTAVGAGAQGVVVSSRSAALLDAEVVRASAGAVFRIPVVQAGNLTATSKALKDAGFWIFGLTGDGAQNLFDVDWPDRVALILGNETSGIRPGLLKTCDAELHIPLANQLDSLNVAVAAGVGLFQIAMQHRASA